MLELKRVAAKSSGSCSMLRLYSLSLARPLNLRRGTAVIWAAPPPAILILFLAKNCVAFTSIVTCLQDFYSVRSTECSQTFYLILRIGVPEPLNSIGVAEVHGFKRRRSKRRHTNRKECFGVFIAKPILFQISALRSASIEQIDLRRETR